MTNTTLTPQVLGQAENAHRALLDRILAGAGAGTTYYHWVALNLVSATGTPVDRDQLAGRMGGALRIDTATAREAITEMTAAGLLEGPPGGGSSVELTGAGRELHRRGGAAPRLHAGGRGRPAGDGPAPPHRGAAAAAPRALTCLPAARWQVLRRACQR